MGALGRLSGAPWTIVKSDDKKRARLNCIAHFLSLIPYNKISQEKIVLGKRRVKGKYNDLVTLEDRNYIPEIY